MLCPFRTPLRVSGPSEIRSVRPRHVGVLSRVPLDVFGASLFHPAGGVIATASISHGRGPWRREHALILDRELKLQVLALMVRVSHPRADVMLLCIPCKPVFGGFGVQEPISFDHVQSR